MQKKPNIVAIKRGPGPDLNKSGDKARASKTAGSDQATAPKGQGMATSGRLEATVKINQIPQSKPTKNGWHQFTIDCDGKQVSVTVRPKLWNKFTAQAEQYAEWVAAIRGNIGKLSSDGFVLEQPSIQVFEKKPKADKKEGSQS